MVVYFAGKEKTKSAWNGNSPAFSRSGPTASCLKFTSVWTLHSGNRIVWLTTLIVWSTDLEEGDSSLCLDDYEGPLSTALVIYRQAVAGML